MDLYASLFLGVLQGVLEWLPLSSSGQGMMVLTGFLGVDARSALQIMFILHSGTMLAVLVRFRSEFLGLAGDVAGLRSSRLLRFMVLTTFFSFASGGVVYLLLLDSFSEAGSGFVMLLVCLFLVVTGVAIHVSKKSYGSGGLGDLSLKDMAVVGLVQGFSVLPGLSRSGVTVASLLLSGVRQEEALRLSFLLSVPVVFAATSAGFYGYASSLTPAVFAGILSAFVVGYLSINGLIYASRRLRFDVFCVLFGLLGFAWAAAHVVLS